MRQLKNHENLVSECWIAEGSDLARQARHDGNFQEAGQRAGNDAHAKLGGRPKADLTVHGGVTKAVYVYPSEHYGYWRTELPGADLRWGMFGENFTTEGLLEEAIYIGDRFGIGESEVMVTEPRMPCYKLGIKFGRADIIKRFLASRRTGFYFAVVRQGRVVTGDAIKLIGQEQQDISVADITRLYAFEKNDLKGLRRAIGVDSLPESWKGYFQHQLDKQIGQFQ